MTTYVIETGVRPPKEIEIGKVGRGRPAVFPFSRMEVGDSFLHAPQGKDPRQALWEIRKLAKSWARRAGNDAEFDGAWTEDGVRVWRTR